MQGKSVLEQLAESQFYRDYECAFAETTGMPLALRPVECWRLANHGKRRENPFCALLTASSRACAACLEVQRQLADTSAHEPQSTVCFAGLREASVPIRAGEQLLGFLYTGAVIVGKPSRSQFARTIRQLRKWGVQADLRKLENAYFHTRTLSPKQYASVLRLLAIFAEHLGLVAHQLALRANHAEPESVAKAREVIAARHAEKLPLDEVARAVNMSASYFCKTFKKATGFTFTDYLSRVRIEEARQLLLNPNARIGEVALEAGFQSLTHFNRTFYRLLGESPSEYRAALPRER